jgi:hypothetical protein
MYSYIANTNIGRQQQNGITNATGSRQPNATADDDLVTICKFFFPSLKPL